jgi:hypothetical protein
LRRDNIKALIAIVLGMVFMIVTVNLTVTYVNSLNEIKKNGIMTYGTRSGGYVGSTRISTVTFLTKDGTEIEAVIPPQGTFIFGSDKLKIYYDPDDPYKVVPAQNGIYYFFGILAASISFFVGIMIIARNLIFKRRAKKLISTGFSVMADVIKVNRYMGKNEFSYIINARYSIGGSVYNFKSRALWYDPSPYLKDKIQVFVDQNNYSNYYIDTNFLNRTNKTGAN